ncbi:MAG: metal-binding protein [Gloeomargarita sp. SKYG116]|nr:metal-binding protein [Gloeomargarita sp. SKYG116]MDW8400631.1 metal-binding protein [Gloeomargarita sp. SKYGB_i_bin116]
MADGATHDRLTLWTAPVVGLATWQLTGGGHWPWVVTSSYVFSGLMFSGDLDIRSRQWRRWGWLRFLWIPYQKLCKHRSFWSHGPLVGTLGRLFYLGLVLGMVLALAWGWSWWQGKPWPLLFWLKQYGSKYQGELLAVGIGLELGAWNHSLADWLSSRWKKWRA